MNPTTKSPDENSSLEMWKAWVHDHEDMYFRNVVVDTGVLLAIIAKRDSEHDRAERILKDYLDDERQRL